MTLLAFLNKQDNMLKFNKNGLSKKPSNPKSCGQNFMNFDRLFPSFPKISMKIKDISSVKM